MFNFQRNKWDALVKVNVSAPHHIQRRLNKLLQRIFLACAQALVRYRAMSRVVGEGETADHVNKGLKLPFQDARCALDQVQSMIGQITDC